ncbi:DUF2242 domain-containing protein [Ramlibacter sp. H39-3-26]|uniref:DUF2242 domain-containing protein n=1 Tax=Curvibacter soli TaxID=3031331 RepID=UPI0031F39641
MRTFRTFRPSAALCAAAIAAGLLAGCAGLPGRPSSMHEVVSAEDFDSTTTHTRRFDAPTGATCEAARRALLSQGYMIGTATEDMVIGRKNFQVSGEDHLELEFRVVCAREGAEQKTSLAFASALQDRYAVKKVNNSASLGVGSLGSLSLPFSASDDAMVKVASETVSDARFYEGFFALLERFLAQRPALQSSTAAASAAAPVK